MKVISINKKEKSKELTLERARELINDYEISDAELQEVIENIKIFCEIVYGIFKKQQLEKELNPDLSEELQQAA
jgi:hypothetical protein